MPFPSPPGKKKIPVKQYVVSDAEEGQRIDNFLLRYWKNIPGSRIYKLLRKEVRVNKKRVSAFYKLQLGDVIRLPPVYLNDPATIPAPSKQITQLLTERILYEDDHLLIINKPAGMAVHLGSTVRIGVIEAMRHMYPKLPQLELAHRLDTETSGCLILAKKKRILKELHVLLREGAISKIYWALTKGIWKKNELKVALPLHKHYKEGGKHVVEVDHQNGKSALTHFHPLKIYAHASLVEVKLYTGRTHQIRVHAAALNHPIAGDDRYGESDFNKMVRQRGLKRMFLHAHSIDFTLPSIGQRIKVVAPLDADLEGYLNVEQTHIK